MVAAVAATTGRIEEVPLGVVMPHPANPPGRVADSPELRGLVESVKAWGVLQPLIVGAAPVGSGCEYLVLDGHRRYAAARAAGVATVPVVVREDLTAEDAAVRLLTDLHKQVLTPLEQAAAFARLVDAGMTQTQVAQRLGVAQGTVSKRLALLRLSPAAQDAVAAGRLPVSDAPLLVADDPELAAAIDQELAHGSASLTGQHVRNRAAAAVARARATAAARAEAERRGADFVADPYERWGPYAWKRRLPEADVEAVAAAGALAVAPGATGGPPVFYHTDSLPTAAQASQDEKSLRRAATRSRRAWLAERVPRLRPTASQVSDRLAMHVLQNRSLTGPDLSMAVQFLAQAGEAVGVGVTGQTRAAYLLSLMDSEIRLGRRYGSFQDPLEQDYLQVLQRGGYQPTPWEQIQMEKKK